MPLHLYAHNPASEGAGELARALGIRRLRHEGSTYVAGPNKTIINWGSSQVPAQFQASRILNPAARVAAASNKLRFFELMEETDVRTPNWTTNIVEARQWFIEDRGVKVVARTVLNGHSGNGIIIAENRLDIPNAPLYTMYVPKKAEYRVHFANGAIIDVQRKIRDPDRQPTNWHVRSHDNGFIYVRNGVADAMPRDVITQAELCILRTGLDFGALDLIYNESRDHAFVLECNTAPGLTGQTVESYANAFRQYL